METGFHWDEGATSWDELVGSFRWDVPDRFNIADWACDRWVGSGRDALLEWHPGAPEKSLSFDALADASKRFANVLLEGGLARGDRVAVLLPQSPETVIAHLACYRAGLIAVPLALLFGPDAIRYRLDFAQVRCLVTNSQGAATLARVSGPLPHLRRTIDVDRDDFVTMLHDASPEHTRVDTKADDPALIIYTSGTTGPPKAALHAHRVLIGHLPGILTLHDLRLRVEDGDRSWTPADWAWAGGLLNTLLTSLAMGVPVVYSRQPKFDPRGAFRLIAEAEVRNAFIPPTALRLMRSAGAGDWQPRLRSLFSGGEALGAATYEWAREAFGLTVNEGYGQTECNIATASCAGLGQARPGAMGRPSPGRDTRILDENGDECAPGDPGTIAIRSPDPIMFLEYFDDEEATNAKFATFDGTRWMLTGDRGYRDADGFLHFQGRDDDIITSAGFRIGPGEIEDCLVQHPAVMLAAAVGKPDAVRTQIVKAYVVVAEEYAADEGLKAELSHFVRQRLSAHEYPREIDFVQEMPLTTTGKVIRRDFRERAAREASNAQQASQA